ncbi:MAG: hypothetical protein M1816_003003 [Peltula sp. TS41687]|nr:MAG: hypothetical protein M1816_003003 [Peltula sp. TS41687]
MQITLLFSCAAIITAVTAQPFTPKVRRDDSTKPSANNANGLDGTNIAMNGVALVGVGGAAGWLGYEILDRFLKGRNKGATDSLTPPDAEGGKEASVRALEERLEGVTFTKEQEDFIDACKGVVISQCIRLHKPVNEQTIELQCRVMAAGDPAKKEPSGFPEDVLSAARNSRGGQRQNPQENPDGHSNNGVNFHSVVSRLQGGLQRIGAVLPKELPSSSRSSRVGLPVMPALPKFNFVP